MLIGLAFAGYFLLRGVGWDTLASHQSLLLAWVGAHPVISASLYLVAYIATAALSLPNASVLTVAGGLLFGAVGGCLLTVCGACIGASVLLVVVRYALAARLKRYHNRVPAVLRARLETDGFSYLLALRLIPLFPFWIVNLAAAVGGVRLLVFVPATLIGIIPTSYILSTIGAGIGSLLARGQTPDLSVLFSLPIMLPLLALAAISLLPAILRRRPRANV